jgi:uncharacterized membrane protein YkvA (DUF1232 family)
MKKSWFRVFRREHRRAHRLLDDPAAIIRAVDQADRVAKRIDAARGPLEQVWDELRTSVRLVRAWARREYTGVGRGTLILLIGALAYFVSPIDAIIDAIPVLGFVDDAAVLAWVTGSVRAELVAFRAWEAQARSEEEAGARPALSTIPDVSTAS